MAMFNGRQAINPLRFGDLICCIKFSRHTSKCIYVYIGIICVDIICSSFLNWYLYMKKETLSLSLSLLIEYYLGKSWIKKNDAVDNLVFVKYWTMLLYLSVYFKRISGMILNLFNWYCIWWQNQSNFTVNLTVIIDI